MLVLDSAEKLRQLLASDPAFKSPNMNQQCKVCNEPAAGFHFGAFTCEGCKSFFGRTYNNMSSISECKNNGVCVINKKNRTSCKACRLRKCVEVGMSKSGSRYGRRSNWFKIHCLLQEQHGLQQGGRKWDEEGNNNVVVGGRFWPDRPPPLVWPLPLLMPLHSILPGPLPSSAPPHLPPPPPPPPSPPPHQDPLTRLQSLGPVQDTPIDLSKSSADRPSAVESLDETKRPRRPPSLTVTPRSRSPSQERQASAKNPLDLTCVK